MSKYGEDSDDELSVNLMTPEEAREARLALEKSNAVSASLTTNGSGNDINSINDTSENSYYCMSCNWCLVQRVFIALAILSSIIAVIVLLIIEQQREYATIEHETSIDSPTASNWTIEAPTTAPT